MIDDQTVSALETAAGCGTRLRQAREAAGPTDAILITGSITLVGQAMLIAREQNWML